MATTRSAAGAHDLELPLQLIGAAVIRYGLALLLLWIGASKFTAYEAMGIVPLVSNSPLMSWASAWSAYVPSRPP
jgi:reactive chlorine resistance protein C